MSDQIKLPVHPLINPLTEDDRAIINQILENLPKIKDLLARAEQCGLDVSDRKDRHEMHQTVATRLKEHFFPNQLPAVSE